MQRDEDEIFPFWWKLCYKKEKTFIIPICTMSQNILNSSISRFSRKWEKGTEHQCMIHGPRFNEHQCTIHNLRSNNAKNHAISLLEMQGCPQSNIKQEIKSFCFTNFTKINNELS